jgi:hypothetical protein
MKQMGIAHVTVPSWAQTSPTHSETPFHEPIHAFMRFENAAAGKDEAQRTPIMPL